MLVAVTILLLCQLVGEVLVQAGSLPVPGPVAGMFLLYIVLTVRGSVPKPLKRVADGLLSRLSLLFVPAGVGIMANLALLRREWPVIVLTVVTSTTLTLVVTAYTMGWLVRRKASLGQMQEG